MTSTAPAARAATPQRLRFHGQGGTLFGIQIVNLLLTIVTLGIYSFWAKVRVRRYLYGQTEFAGDRFAYHGRGKELFIGALKAFGLIVLFYVLLVIAQMLIGDVAVLLLYLAILVAIPFALYGAMRYALSRTSWRGIRFSFRGDLKECISTYLGGMLLTLLTLGIYYPWFRTRMRSYWVNNTYFGNTPFRFQADAKELIGGYLLAILLTIPTLYLVWFWFAAKVHRFDWAHTQFAEAPFRSTYTGGGLLWLTISNLLLVVVTLGLAFPWVLIRTLRYQFDNTLMEGQVDWTRVQQDAQARVGATGEGLADALDIGSALG